MNSKGYVAIAAVAVLVVAGVGAAILSAPHDDGFKYDPTKGWASWDPVLTNTSSTNMTGSAYIAQVADYWVKTLYDIDIDYSKYSISDVPSDFLPYESLISVNGDGDYVIKSMIRDDGETEYHAKEITVSKTPTDYIICAASFSSTVYTIMCAAHGKEYTDYDAEVVKEFYQKIYAGDNGFINDFPICSTIDLRGEDSF